MVIRMRSTRSHTGNRRSHHRLDEPRLAECECGAFHQKHRACHNCGKYRGRQVINVVARAEKTARRTKRKNDEAKAMGMEPVTTEKEHDGHDHSSHEHTSEEKKETKPSRGKSRKKAGDDAKGA